jgi:hypothetical protein
MTIRRRHRVAIDQAHLLAEGAERKGQRHLRAQRVAVWPRVGGQDKRLALSKSGGNGSWQTSVRVLRVVLRFSGCSGSRVLGG